VHCRWRVDVLRQQRLRAGAATDAPRIAWFAQCLVPPDRAVFYPDDERFLVDRELTVRHYEIAFEDGA